MRSSFEADLARATDHLERLQRVSRELNGAVTVDDVTHVVMNVLDVPGWSPSRGLWLHRAGSDALHLVAAMGLRPATVERFASLSLDDDLPGPIAYRERRTVTSESQARSEQEFDALQGVERSTEGFVTVPLLFEELCLGVLGLGYDEAIDDQDKSFVETIAGQVAQTLVRVRLAELDRRRRVELEFLADLTGAALGASDHLELMNRVTEAAVPMLGDWCSLYFVPEDGDRAQIAVAHVDPDKVAWVRDLQRRYPFDLNRERGVAAVIRSGETEFVPDVTEEQIEDAIAHSGIAPDEARGVLEAFQLTSVITVPLLTKRRVVGAMQFTSAESGRRYDEDDVALAEAVAGRLAEALDSAWLSDHHRHIAVTLQRALLPPRLPSIPGIDIAARYWPAGGAAVGGDFYDVFALGDDRWCVVIGDSCGTGPNAAALTSIARHTVRAAARHGAAPTEIMDWLNQAVLLSDRDLFCTACFVTVVRDGIGWRATSVAAGHPLPILASPGHAPHVIGRPGTLLGTFDSISTSACDVVLRPGDLIVFYTDGVTDLRPPYGLTPAEMLDLVESVRDRGRAADVAEAIHESVLARVPEPSSQDDIAVVVLRVDGDCASRAVTG